MNKNEALDILELKDDGSLTIPVIEEKVDKLSKQFDPKYKPKEVYDLIRYQPDQDKYDDLVEAANLLNQYVQNKNAAKEEKKYITGTDILAPRSQNEGEKLTDYYLYKSGFYEKIIVEQYNEIEKLKAQLENKTNKDEQTETKNNETVFETQVSPNLDDKSESLKNVTTPTFPFEEETLDNINGDHATSMADIDEAIDNANKTLDTIETPVDQPIVEEPAVEKQTVIEPIVKKDDSNKVIDQEPYNDSTKNEVSNEQLNNALAKLTDGVNYNTAKETAKKFTAKSIQVTKSFVSYLKNTDFKCQLKKQFNKVIKVPVAYFKQVGQKIENLKDNNQEIIKENLSKLSQDELKVLTDEYYKNGLDNFDDITKKAIENHILKTQQASAIDLEEIIQNEKDELMGANDKIVALHSMADVLINNEPQKAVYENLIQQQYNGAAEKIKDLREKEANLNNINTKEDDKGNFFENIINKLPFGHKEKTDEHSSEYQLLDEHKKSLAKLKEFEQKAILEHNDAKALKAFGAVEEQQAIINEEEEKLMGNGKSL